MNNFRCKICGEEFENLPMVCPTPGCNNRNPALWENIVPVDPQPVLSDEELRELEMRKAEERRRSEAEKNAEKHEQEKYAVKQNETYPEQQTNQQAGNSNSANKKTKKKGHIKVFVIISISILLILVIAVLCSVLWLRSEDNSGSEKPPKETTTTETTTTTKSQTTTTSKTTETITTTVLSENDDVEFIPVISITRAADNEVEITLEGRLLENILPENAENIRVQPYYLSSPEFYEGVPDFDELISLGSCDYRLNITWIEVPDADDVIIYYAYKAEYDVGDVHYEYQSPIQSMTL